MSTKIAGGPPQPWIGPLRPAFDRLVEIAKLGEDWDTYGGIPPTSVAIASTSQLILAVADRLAYDVAEAVAPYSVMPFPDGGVQVTWRRTSSELQIDVSPTGDLGYLRIDGEGEARKTFEADSVPLVKVMATIEQFLR